MLVDNPLRFMTAVIILNVALGYLLNGYIKKFFLIAIFAPFFHITTVFIILFLLLIKFDYFILRQKKIVLIVFFFIVSFIFKEIGQYLLLNIVVVLMLTHILSFVMIKKT